MKTFTITAWLESPLNCSQKATGAYFLSSLDHIPGRSLLGACAWHWIDSGGNPESAEFRTRFVDGTLSWGTLYSVPLAAPGALALPGLPSVVPLTTGTCKLFGIQHGVVDSLLAPTSARTCSFRVGGQSCGSGIKRLTGVVLLDAHANGSSASSTIRSGKAVRMSSVSRQRRTHLSVGFQTGVARNGYLYSREVLEEGQAFRGRLVCHDEGLADTILDELNELSVSIGSGRSRGYGRIRLHIAPESPAVILPEDLQAFTSLAQQRFQPKDGKSIGQIFALTAASPWLLREDDGRSSVTLSHQKLAEVLELPLDEVEILGGEHRIETRPGWDAAAGMPIESRTLIAAGSTYLCRVKGLSPENLAERLNQLSQRGLGSLGVEGLGRVVVNHPIHCHTECHTESHA